MLVCVCSLFVPGLNVCQWMCALLVPGRYVCQCMCALLLPGHYICQYIYVCSAFPLILRLSMYVCLTRPQTLHFSVYVCLTCLWPLHLSVYVCPTCPRTLRLSCMFVRVHVPYLGCSLYFTQVRVIMYTKLCRHRDPCPDTGNNELTEFPQSQRKGNNESTRPTNQSSVPFCLPP